MMLPLSMDPPCRRVCPIVNRTKQLEKRGNRAAGPKASFDEITKVRRRMARETHGETVESGKKRTTPY